MTHAPAAIVERHAYVADAATGAVLRFPLQADALAPRPDAILRGLSDPRGVAIGPNGNVYVVERGTQRVVVYPRVPNSASRPIAVLPIPHAAGVGAIAVDASGYAYAGWTQVCTTEGFSCGFATVYSPLPHVRPIATLSFGGGGGGPSTAEPRALPVNVERFLAAAAGGATPVVYDDAPRVGAAYFTFCGAVNTTGVAWGPQRTLYEADAGGIQPKTASQVVVVPDYRRGKTSNCPNFYTITSSTLPLRAPRGIATFDGLLYVTSAYEPRTGGAAVFSFNPSIAGRQVPREVVTGDASMLRNPQGIAIGP
ncbi:MAG: hypothetical protein JO241_03035 [Candidatus Eremiobacteraeota bacterium]|nr:hypothetical protein [Candidatus Eremiobacteraeota bacterium]MBV8284118.1 hypothetical protein [Candidatus Eremiobacteraeota bacterium]MBV8582945.1 hypothetical protein [Candidatus Eremiobacteraeota bacterium]